MKAVIKVLITGHTGFKGSWMTRWLMRLGARVTGYSLAPQTSPSHFALFQPQMHSVMGDIRDLPLKRSCSDQSVTKSRSPSHGKFNFEKSSCGV